MLGNVAPVTFAPEIGLSAALIGLALVWVVLWGLHLGYESTLGALLRWLADHTSVKIWKFHIGVGGEFAKVDHWMKGRIADGMHAVEHAMSATVHWMEYTWRLTVDALEWFARETVGAIDTLASGTIPAAVGALTAPLHAAISDIYRELRHVVQEGQTLALRYAHTIEAEMTREFGAAWRGIDALGRTIEGTLAAGLDAVGARVAHLADYIYHGISARLGHLERLLAGGLIAAIALEAITRVWPYWKCANVRRAARGICRMDSALLDLLLGVGVEALIVSDLCDFIAGVAAAAKRVEPLLLDFVSVENALIGCHGITAPPLLSLPAVAIPAQSDKVALAA